VRSLLRAGVGVTDAKLAMMTAAIADAAQVQASRLEDINAQTGIEQIDSLRMRLGRSAQSISRLEPIDRSFMARIRI